MAITRFKCVKCGGILDWEDADIKNIDKKILMEETIEEIECEDCKYKNKVQATIIFDVY